MLIFPSLLPDETLYSLIARVARLNGIEHLVLVGILMGQDYPISALSCPVNMQHFYKITKGAYGLPQEILHNQTVLPLLAHLGELDPSYLTNVANGKCQPHLIELMFGRRKGCKWKICILCAQKDKAKYGIAYWHREHQLQTSYCCVKHGVYLSVLEINHVQLHGHLILPYEVMMYAAVDPVETKENKCDEMSYLLAKIGQTALADTSSPVSTQTIIRTLTDGLEQMGLLNDHGGLKFREYKEKFSIEFGNEPEALKLMQQAKLSNPKQLLYGITDQRAAKRFARLLLVKWMFESWGSYKEQCRWQEMLDSGGFDDEEMGTHLNDKSDGQLAHVMLQQYRQVCLGYKESLVSPTRFEFLKMHYRAFKWLRTNDRIWLDSELPMVRIGKGQKLLFK